MKRIYLWWSVWAFSAICWGQNNAADDIGALLKAGMLAEAEELTNRYLTEDPTNVDAIVMRGNVVLNKYLYEQQTLQSITQDYDETVYDAALRPANSAAVVVPEKTANGIAKLWNAALKLDPARGDIHLGLCQLYSLALMKTALLAQLPLAKAANENVEDLPVHLTLYARNLEIRGDFTGAMEVYRSLNRLFPGRPGLLSDMAGAFFFREMPDSARYYATQLLRAKTADTSALQNAFVLLSLLDAKDEALEALRRLPGNDHLFYEGLLKFEKGEKGWQKPLKKFLDNQPDSADAAVAALLVSDTFRLTIDNYLQIIEHDLSDGFKLLLHRKFSETGHFIPRFNLAELWCFHRQYGKAVAAFQQMEAAGSSLEGADSENFDFYFAWSLHQNGQREAALPRWERLLFSEEFFKQSAAAWFLGKFYFDKGEKTKGRDYFSQVAARANESKFATMCWQYMGVD